MKYKTSYNLNHINSIETLHREQQVVRNRLEQKEDALRLKMYEIPAEVAAASLNKFIPNILRGKVTNTVLGGGKKLINALFVPEQKQANNLLTTTVKNRGVFSLIKKGIALFKKR